MCQTPAGGDEPVWGSGRQVSAGCLRGAGCRSVGPVQRARLSLTCDCVSMFRSEHVCVSECFSVPLYLLCTRNINMLGGGDCRENLGKEEMVE